jgi:hypothetical protein
MDLFHLEFEEFGLVFANGVASETFLDVGNRGGFDNAVAEPGRLGKASV